VRTDYVRNQRWLPLTGTRLETTYISYRTHDGKKNSMAKPMFAGVRQHKETDENTVQVIEEQSTRHCNAKYRSQDEC